MQWIKKRLKNFLNQLWIIKAYVIKINSMGHKQRDKLKIIKKIIIIIISNNNKNRKFKLNLDNINNKKSIIKKS